MADHQYNCLAVHTIHNTTLNTHHIEQLAVQNRCLENFRHNLHTNLQIVVLKIFLIIIVYNILLNWKLKFKLPFGCRAFKIGMWVFVIHWNFCWPWWNGLIFLPWSFMPICKTWTYVCFLLYRTWEKFTFNVIIKSYY